MKKGYKYPDLPNTSNLVEPVKVGVPAFDGQKQLLGPQRPPKMKAIIITIFLVLLIFTFFLGVTVGAYKSVPIVQLPAPIVYATGYEIFNAVNNYRVKSGLKPLELYEPLCNNIAERRQSYGINNSHTGIEEFIKKNMPQIVSVSEILGFGNTAEETVQAWSSSPSHDLSIKSNNKGCAYSQDGYSVVLMSK